MSKSNPGAQNASLGPENNALLGEVWSSLAVMPGRPSWVGKRRWCLGKTLRYTRNSSKWMDLFGSLKSLCKRQTMGRAAQASRWSTGHLIVLFCVLVLGTRTQKYTHTLCICRNICWENEWVRATFQPDGQKMHLQLQLGLLGFFLWVRSTYNPFT